MKRVTFSGANNGSIVGILDIDFAAENILLAVHALGLGGCAIASFNASCIKKVINAPVTPISSPICPRRKCCPKSSI